MSFAVCVICLREAGEARPSEEGRNGVNIDEQLAGRHLSRHYLFS